jgi:hypothetical protein
MDQNQKVVFRLDQDEAGYPPASYERLWTIPLSNPRTLSQSDHPQPKAD